jgi:outer membrane protein assembly factor BamB
MRRVGLSLTVLAALIAGCTSGDVSGPSAASPATAPSTSEPMTTAPSTAPSNSPTPDPGVDWLMYHGDPARSGVARAFPPPTRLVVAQALKLDAEVYASPLVIGAITVVATENNSVYGLDAAGRQVWRTRLGDPVPRAELPCGNIDPSGITGTPVYDPGTGSVFVVPEYRAPVRHQLVALDARTGALRWRVDVDLPGTSPDAMQERGALAVSGGRVWVPFGGRNGDCGDYKGRLVGVRLDGSGAPVSYTVPTTREAGMWTPPGAVVDASGRLLAAVGNGESGPGDRYDYSDSILAIDPADATLTDSFSPTTWASDNADDLDLGSQGPALVGTKWVFAAGKSGMAYVLRQNAFGGIGGQVSQASVCRSFGGTAVDGDVVYVPCTDGLRAVRIGATGAMTMLWQASESIAGSPVVGGGRVWSLAVGDGVLHALDPASGRSLAQVSVGVTSRFATPALSGTRILVPTLGGLTIVATG